MIISLISSVVVSTILTIVSAGPTVVNAKQNVVVNQSANVNSSSTGYLKDQCKNGGWQALGFKNQGQCVSFFASGGKAPGN
jgi:hypothetical protein